MRTALLAVACAGFLTLPAAAQDQMVTLKAEQIGQVFCLSRIGNDEALIDGILTRDLQMAIAVAEKQDAAYSRKHKGDKPPLGDGIPWQSSPDYAAKCDTGLVTLSKLDARVELKYGFPDDAAADFTDILILKKIDQPSFNVGFWRIDNVMYPDGTDLKAALVDAFKSN